MGKVREIQTVLDNILLDMVLAGKHGQLLDDAVREEAEAAGVSDYFINQYVKNLEGGSWLNYHLPELNEDDMYDGD